MSFDVRFSSSWYQRGVSRLEAGFDFRLSCIRGVEAGGSAPVSKEYGKSQPVTAHCARFFPSRVVQSSLELSTKPTLSPMWQRQFPFAPAAYGSEELELELVQSHMAQKPVLRGKVAQRKSLSTRGLGPFASPPLPLCRIQLILLLALPLGLIMTPRFADLGLWPLGAQPSLNPLPPPL